MKITQRHRATSGIDRILALDMATSSGWATHDERGDQRFGSITFPSADNRRYTEAATWLIKTIDRFQPALIALEEPASTRNMYADRVMGGMWAIVQCIAGKRLIAVHPVKVKSWKQAMTGNGNATRDSYIAAAKALGYQVKNQDDAAAIGILRYILALIAK